MSTLFRRALAAAFLITAPLAAAGCGDDAPQELIGYALQPPTSVADLSLPRADSGEPYVFKAAPGRVMLAYFGYTHCPDVCPTSLAAIKAALRQIGEDRASRVDLAMVTVDPDRDTAAVLGPYVQSFVPSAVALRATDADVLRPVATRFGVEYSVTTNASGAIDVTHTGSILAVDDQGVLVDTMPFGITPADIANDLVVLLGRSGG